MILAQQQIEKLGELSESVGALPRRQRRITEHVHVEAAAEHYISAATVERHLATIYRSLWLSGRVDATRYVIDNGLAGPR